MSKDLVVRVVDRQAALESLDEIADLYAQVYAEPPYNAADKYSRNRFLQRTRDQAVASGFKLTTVRRGDALVGFTFGFTMPPGAWWKNASKPAAEVLEADKFAVVELVVAKTERGQGLGRRLMDALLAGRQERFATLAAVLDADAYGMYLRWGWTKAAEFRAEPPFSDALVLNIPHGGDGSGA
ncbi:GNAT family N-acetyltransferase [Actinomadura violacea]|uniref:GNAT family N-acetyltransferase n=1 Tax=Actinomadura violacea TaxID=2819934 RepID=A0ABS3S9G5_9ACTN|nr:GNAT family N-acetyltransferase [Actinomadura violacea]MBO2465378.1 GNAT family N-acetyltransferase [Actinomadura violacea]